MDNNTFTRSIQSVSKSELQGQIHVKLAVHDFGKNFRRNRGLKANRSSSVAKFSFKLSDDDSTAAERPNLSVERANHMLIKDPLVSSC